MEITISVRNLVEFILRGGDIDNRHTTSPEDAMQEGGRIHRMLQRRAGADYHAEVVLRHRVETEQYTICVEGRADGIIDGETARKMLPVLQGSEIPENPVVIDEIKGVYQDVMKMKDAVPVHLAQAKCYAFFYACEKEIGRIRVRLTYCNMDTEEIQYFFYEYSLQELQEWFDDLMRQYRKWADYTVQWKQIRQQSIHELEFPFEYRPGQKKLVTYVYQTIYHKRKLFLEAPTGVGKTISTVFPSVKAVGEELAEKLFYLTAKTITRTVAEEAFDGLRKQGLQFKTVILTAKEKICFLEKPECNPGACPYAKGHFDRINEAVYDMLTHEVSFTRELIEAYARKHTVCPFEFCLDMSLFSDGVICDYNYAFDPHAYLRRFFAEGSRKDYIFLIDEAHNLVDRGREMYSALLRKEDFLELKSTVKVQEPRVASALEKCNKELLSLKKECENYQILETIDPFILTLNRLSSVMEKVLEEHADSPVREDILNFYFEVSHFLLIYDKLDENYIMYSEMESDGSFILKLFCVDPSVNLKECMTRARSSILFSATLLPIQYYKKLLGGEPEDYEVYADSIFDPARRALFLACDVTTKYSRRSLEEYEKIASYIQQITRQRKGNYLIFFPSHAFLQDIYGIYCDEYLDAEREECILQEEYMKEESREEFLGRFAQSEKSLLGFCVMGGIFSEGIDLKADRLIGAILVGTGLPQVCNEREMISRFFEEETQDGFSYAYQFPGMNKVLQAAGRVIRTSGDIGVVVLLDERFRQRSYQQLFPKEWESYRVISRDTAAAETRQFWQKWKDD